MKLSILFVMCLFSLVMPPLHAEETHHEIVLSGVSGDFSFGGGTTRIGVSADYHYSLIPETLQFGIQSAITYAQSATSSSTIVTMLAGPTLNFPMTEMRNAFFLAGGVGFVFAESSTTSIMNLAFAFTLGKRIQILENLTYRPSFAITKVSGASALFVLSLLSFSLVL